MAQCPRQGRPSPLAALSAMTNLSDYPPLLPRSPLTRPDWRDGDARV